MAHHGLERHQYTIYGPLQSKMSDRSKVNYRKIYVDHYGKIPVDDDGRTYHIHHIDGDRDNNDPSNLIALSLKEHYDIHYAQGDWAACSRLATLLRLSKEEISTLLSRANNAGLCGFRLGHASNAGKKGGRIFAENAKKSGRQLFQLSNQQKILRLYNSQVSSAIRGETACEYPKKTEEEKYTFVNVKTNQKIHSTIAEFCITQNLSDYFYFVRDMIKNNRPTYKEWTVEGRTISHSEKMKGKLAGNNHPSYDNTVHTFKNDDGRQETCTQYDLRMKHGLPQGNMSALMNGRKKSVYGWRLVTIP
jgi:hypothetical protein